MVSTVSFPANAVRTFSEDFQWGLSVGTFSGGNVAFCLRITRTEIGLVGEVFSGGISRIQNTSKYYWAMDQDG